MDELAELWVAPSHAGRGVSRGLLERCWPKPADPGARPDRGCDRHAGRPDALHRVRRDARERPLAHAPSGRPATSSSARRRSTSPSRTCTCSPPSGRWRSGSGSSRTRSATSGRGCTSSSAAPATASPRSTRSPATPPRVCWVSNLGDIGPAVGEQSREPDPGRAGVARPGREDAGAGDLRRLLHHRRPGGCSTACAGSASGCTGRPGSCRRCRCRASTATWPTRPAKTALSAS